MTTGFVYCNEDLPTKNPVQAIDLNALDEIVLDKKFSGLAVAMASWCPPCRQELPILSKLYQKYRYKDIQIVAFSLDTEGPEAVQPLINELKVTFPVYWVGAQAVQHYQIVGIPTMLIYDKGKLIEKLPGSHPQRAIEDKIKALLATSHKE